MGNKNLNEYLWSRQIPQEKHERPIIKFDKLHVQAYLNTSNTSFFVEPIVIFVFSVNKLHLDVKEKKFSLKGQTKQRN